MSPNGITLARLLLVAVLVFVVLHDFPTPIDGGAVKAFSGG